MSFPAIIAAVIVNMILGWLWYSPMLFGEHWMRHRGVADKKNRQKMQQEGHKAMVAMALVALVTAFVFETVFNNFDVTGVGAGIVVAFWIWLGFVVTTQISAVLFENQPWQVFWINTSYRFLSLMAMGAILGRW